MPKKLTNEEYNKKIESKNLIALESYIKTNINIKHQCLICNYEFYDNPHAILRKKWKCDGCYADIHNIVIGINDMWTTAPEQAAMLNNPEDGYKYTYGSNKKVDWKCVNCKNIIRNKMINDVNKDGLSCPVCSDGVSYPQKFMGNILKQLNIDFETEKIFDWCKYKLNENDTFGKYDFVFEYNNKNYIIETDGGIGHGGKIHTKGKYTKEDLIYIDDMKDALALKNNFNLIRIDCRQSDCEYIKNNIENSELNLLFDLNNIDWELCHKNSLKSKIIEACELWNNGIKSTSKISVLLSLSHSATYTYLKRGAKIKLCDYDAKQASRDNGKIQGKKFEKQVICINTNQIFGSIAKAAKHFSINRGHISEYLHGKRKSAGKIIDTGEKLIFEYYNKEKHKNFTFIK